MSAVTLAQSAVPGEYYLRGVMEVGSGFLFKPDSTFQFFFSYGALDREGSGTWTLKGNEVVLNSRPRPLHDFALVNSYKNGNGKITIRIVDNNPLLVRYVFGRMVFADSTIEAMANDSGEIVFPEKPVKSLTLVFRFCPEKESVFPLKPGPDHYEFRFEPWLAEYFFRDHHFNIGDGRLQGKHPLLDDKEYIFEKAK